MRLIQRAVIVGLVRSGVKRFEYRDSRSHKVGKRYREIRYLELLATNNTPTTLKEITDCFGYKSSRVTQNSLREIDSAVRKLLEPSAIKMRVEGATHQLQRRDPENEPGEGYCFDGLRFAFRKLPKPLLGGLDRVLFRWTDPSACGKTCGVGVALKCATKHGRIFNPILPQSVDSYRAAQDALRKKKNWKNLMVLKVLKMELESRSGDTLIIESCKAEYRDFDCTNYALPYLLQLDGQPVIHDGMMVDPRTVPKLQKLPLAMFGPRTVPEIKVPPGTATFRKHLSIPDGFNREPDSWILGTNLGYSVCIIQVDSANSPKGMLLSWRARRPRHDSVSTSLRTGFDELHVGASSQIKLQYHLQEAPDDLDDRQHLSESDVRTSWSPLDLKKAIQKECYWEAGILPEEIKDYHFLGAGWMTDLLHPELLLAVTTTRDFTNNAPDFPGLRHADEFREDGKGKFFIPFDQDYWGKLASILVGISPDDPHTLVRWSPQGAVALIEAHRLPLFESSAIKQLEEAVANVIETKMINLLPEPLFFVPPPKNEKES